MSTSFTQLPNSSEAFAQLEWSQVEPWYRELAAATLSPETLEPWMLQWSQLSSLVDETYWLLEIATTQDTSDESRTLRRQRWLDEVYTNIQTHDQQAKQQLLDSKLEPAGFAVPLRNLRADVALYREVNLPLLNEEKKLNEKYMEINGVQTVMWDGEEVPITKLWPDLENPDRARRELAWHTLMERKFADRDALNDVWVRNFKLRQEIARNTGFNNFREYRWQQLYRFDYTPDDCKRFHDAVEQVIVPIARQLNEKRRTLLGVETLRPWDRWVDPRSSEAPHMITDVNEMLQQVAGLFHTVDPTLGDHFDTMVQENCFDIETRANKAPGGYNLPLEVKHLPFIFGQVQTISDAIGLVFHEAGHAFHVFETASLPYLHQRKENSVPMEFAEVASTSMEFVGNMHLASSGLCTEKEARRLRLQHLEGSLTLLLACMKGDAFQHWLYENPEQAIDPAAVDEKWAELGERFESGTDWSGLDAARRFSWQHTLHFFEVPFYFIEYAFATLGALQVWRNYMRDPQSAIQQYRHGLSLGATRPLPELYAAVGAKFAADPAILQDLAQLVLQTIEELEQEA